MSRLLQVVIAVVGLVLTFVLQQASNRNSEVQNAQGLVQLYTQEVASALQTCNLPMLQVAQDHAIELNRLRTIGVLPGNTDFEAHVVLVGDTMTSCVAAGGAQAGTPETTTMAAEAPAPAPIDSNLVAQSRNLELRGVERQMAQSSAPAAADGASGRSYAVLASYPVSDDATYDAQTGLAAHYNQLASAVASQNMHVEVYRTSISNHFAIVIPADSEAAANDIVSRARREGWSPDAFVQMERRWVRCQTPTTEGLRACAGTARRVPTRGVVARSPD
jgi:hypothetical protein